MDSSETFDIFLQIRIYNTTFSYNKSSFGCFRSNGSNNYGPIVRLFHICINFSSIKKKSTKSFPWRLLKMATKSVFKNGRKILNFNLVRSRQNAKLKKGQNNDHELQTI